MSRWIFRMSSCGSNVGMETTAPVVSAIVCSTPTHTPVRCRLKSFTSCYFLVDSLPRFCNEMYWGQGCSVGRKLDFHTGLLHYCTFKLEAANDAQNVRVDRARSKNNDQQNLSEMIMLYRSVYNNNSNNNNSNNQISIAPYASYKCLKIPIILFISL